MKKLEPGQSLAILANVGVVAGIFLVAYELRQNTIATRLSVAESFTAQLSEMELRLAESPKLSEILQRASRGEHLSDADQFRINLFYRQALRAWQYMHYQYLSSALDEEL